ncbi:MULTISPECIES: glycosyltransferase family 4 protein [unclassified Tolypothrix]|uniref:glycosyltransferase family 4 protein n=1 Tax=unclassified Tolypothrix TaxID=2649714 RepID=UPI0005EAB70C|nr:MULTISPECIES: glycosyltransferase family 4 protein [unclassified Tolypothrix]BAY88159.1 putative glycosyl transferase [Microchaete diplosiphon NIES-3275]EKF02011.1 glycosyltransferase, group 1 family [Tolypothrix sp. PCC 7601]MBE9087387.1 glycosyltransferase family 4 protein [Tolypothrix sp. LEGE 11397]UYD28863.1 glycosyltransferase family 4 protein [Tolypothrix sp. PCC 7712]UYD35226.1 glycosyltransferase family 4 protein [Tolypothrix sp. PCC 7601]
MTESKIAYITFDTVPAPKGAAIHIAAFSIALATAFEQVQLITVSPTATGIDYQEIYPQVRQTTLPAIGETLIHRVLYFRQLLKAWLKGKRFEVIQIRSIYEGFPIARNKQKYCDRLIFEVNGLPSIELKYRYPAVAEDRELLHKLHSQEQICLEAADLIVTPSSITSAYLQNRGISRDKIRVIPNGVDLKIFTNDQGQRTNDKRQIIYFGTLSPWQGVNQAVEALSLINRDFPANLKVIGQARNYQLKALKQLALKLGVADKLTILEPMPQTQLVANIHNCDVILAPLMPSDRNLIQGCCPLKILEGMATGIPVIASDLPVVRELGEDGVHFLLVKPGSAKSIKDAVFSLKNQPELATKLAINARQRIEEYYTWQIAGEALINAYTELGINRTIKV